MPLHCPKTPESESSPLSPRLAPLRLCALALVLSTFSALATDFPLSTAGNTYGTTLLSLTTSNKTGTAIYVEGFSQHTIQIRTHCTNAVSNIISGSLDNTNWVNLATNSVSSSLTNAVLLSNQRWSYLRATFGQQTAAGSTNSILYLGSRP